MNCMFVYVKKQNNKKLKKILHYDHSKKGYYGLPEDIDYAAGICKDIKTAVNNGRVTYFC